MLLPHLQCTLLPFESVTWPTDPLIFWTDNGVIRSHRMRCRAAPQRNATQARNASHTMWTNFTDCQIRTETCPRWLRLPITVVINKLVSKSIYIAQLSSRTHNALCISIEQTNTVDILFSVGQSPFGCSSCLEYLRQRVLILLKTLAQYKPCTYLLTYLLTCV